ncbi:MAG: hypothetical protein OCD76_21685 [Reichenbachiella sp.]
MELQELIRLLLRNKFYILLIPILSGAIAFTLRFKSDRTYIAESQISTGLTIANDLVGENRKLNPFEIAISFGNITENMTSKLVINRLAYKILYRELSVENPYRIPDLEGSNISMPEGDSLEVVLSQLRIAIDGYELIKRNSDIGHYIYELLDKYAYNEEDLLKTIKIYRVGNTDFINIKFSSEIPTLSSFIVNLWSDNFLEYNSNQKKLYLNESLEVLSDILGEKQKLLDQNVNKLNKYKSRYLYRNSETETDPISEYERLIREKESNIRSVNFRLQDIRKKIADSDQSSNFKSRQQIIHLKNQIDELSTRLISESNNIQLADSIEVLRGDLQSQMYLHASSGSDKNNLDDLFKDENNLELEYQIALADLHKLKGQYQVEKGMVQNLAANKSALDNLETEVQQARQEFMTAQDRYNQARSQLLTGKEAIKLSYYSDIPQEPESRKTIVFTGAGFIGGFVITLFIILSLDFLDFRLKNVFKFTKATGFKPSELIPTISKENVQLPSVIQGKHLEKIILNSTNLLQTINIIRFSLLPDKNSKIVVFTSLRPNTGKSFLLTSIAHAFSLLEKKVLIMDTNYRNASLTNSLINQDNPNIESVESIITNKSLNKIEQLIQPTQNKKIDLLRGATFNKTPEEVFAKLNLSEIISTLEKSYDVILMEGAALNNYSDTRELIKYASKTVCVYSAEDQFDSIDKQSLQFLTNKDNIEQLHILNKLTHKELDVK